MIRTLQGGEPEDYRRHYLKMKSVLLDRASGFPAIPLLLDPLRTWLDRRRRIGVLHVEVADLDLVESLYGWQVFDRIVNHAATFLRSVPGNELPPETLIAINRVAGDRFALFVPERAGGVEVDEAYLAQCGRHLAGRLVRVFETDEFLGLNPPLKFRVGHATLSENPFFRFDRCVYMALQAARAVHGHRERRRERTWEDELRAIIRDGSIDTLFQPIVSLQDRAVLGYEALSRGPSETLFEMPRPMFEMSGRTGTSAELDRLCCKTALNSFCGEIDQGKLFVNLLPETLDPPRPGNALHALIESVDVDPSTLVLEISERRVGDASDLLSGIAGLRQVGCTVALDDVGTGAASMRTIEDLRPDYLKLDPSMIRGIDSNLIKQEILRTLVRLAQRIGATVIAEGVEEHEEARTLADAGAAYAQGFYFAQPATARSVRHKRDIERDRD